MSDNNSSHLHDCSDDNELHVFLDIQIGDIKAGRVIIELYKNVVPKTVENFRQLCTGEAGKDKNGIQLSYKNTTFDRVLPQFMIQGGDITGSKSNRSVSIYGGPFEDENFKISHDRIGLVGMANNGPNTNSSQFYITTVTCEHLDNRNVVFGKVIKGFGTVKEISEVIRDEEDKPLLTCTIINCGEIKDGCFGIEENDGTLDCYPPYPEDFLFPSTNLETVISNIKESGNYFFNKQNYAIAGRKYQKVIHYVKYVIENCNNHDRNVLKKMRSFALANLAAVKLKLGYHSEVIQLCDDLLEIDPQNGKVIYRRGVAHFKLKEYDKAIDDLELAMKLSPTDQTIEELCATVRKQRLRYIQQERNIYSKMFQN